jgi:hypothetical protein
VQQSLEKLELNKKIQPLMWKHKVWALVNILQIHATRNSGNFIDLVKLISKYDPVPHGPFHHINKNQTCGYFLSDEIQN